MRSFLAATFATLPFAALQAEPFPATPEDLLVRLQATPRPSSGGDRACLRDGRTRRSGGSP